MLAGAPPPTSTWWQMFERVPHPLAPMVDGCDEEDVVQVAGLAMRIVHHQHVAGREVLGPVLGPPRAAPAGRW